MGVKNFKRLLISIPNFGFGSTPGTPTQYILFFWVKCLTQPNRPKKKKTNSEQPFKPALDDSHFKILPLAQKLWSNRKTKHGCSAHWPPSFRTDSRSPQPHHCTGRLDTAAPRSGTWTPPDTGCQWRELSARPHCTGPSPASKAGASSSQQLCTPDSDAWPEFCWHIQEPVRTGWWALYTWPCQAWHQRTLCSCSATSRSTWELFWAQRSTRSNRGGTSSQWIRRCVSVPCRCTLWLCLVFRPRTRSNRRNTASMNSKVCCIRREKKTFENKVCDT